MAAVYGSVQIAAPDLACAEAPRTAAPQKHPSLSPRGPRRGYARGHTGGGGRGDARRAQFPRMAHQQWRHAGHTRKLGGDRGQIETGAGDPDTGPFVLRARWDPLRPAEPKTAAREASKALDVPRTSMRRLLAEFRTCLDYFGAATPPPGLIDRAGGRPFPCT